jgi:hypothetical protein
MLRDALNDLSIIDWIYKGLIHYMLTKHGSALHLPRLTSHNCITSPISRILFLFKTTGVIYLDNEFRKFPLQGNSNTTQKILDDSYQ